MADTFSTIDSHCHLDRFHQRGELEAVIDQAADAGVHRLITIGTSAEDWPLYAELGARYPGVVDYTVGLHPCSVGEDWASQVEQLEAYFGGEGRPPVGVGEVGLDYFHLPGKDPARAEQLRNLQREALRAQLNLVKKRDCPVVIHSRGAFSDCIQELDEAEINWDKVVFHCFAEDGGAIQALNERGGRGSFTGIITFKNAGDVREAALAQGLDRFMVETDAPYLAPEPHRGKLCFPAYTALTLKFCAGLFRMDENELARLSRRNTEAFFGLD